MKRLLIPLALLLLLALPVTAFAGDRYGNRGRDGNDNRSQPELRSAYRSGADTAARMSRGCRISGSTTLVVDCASNGGALIVYSVTLAGAPRGKVQTSVGATGAVSRMKHFTIVRSSRYAYRAIVTVTIKGKARVELRGVSISYYS